MTELQLEATSRTPAVTLDPAAGKLVIAGESYPEDITAFYAQLTGALSVYFDNGADGLSADIKLTYFNSSSARALMELLEQLDEAAGNGRTVTIDWYCDPDDDITREFAEDIASDVSSAKVTILDLDAD
ncbi:MAG: DUF1987 domain-containing protein [Candidatus Puniceispirillaceae bacterium]